VRLLNAAVTNDPNLKGLVPLANSGLALPALIHHHILFCRYWCARTEPDRHNRAGNYQR